MQASKVKQNGTRMVEQHRIMNRPECQIQPEQPYRQVQDISLAMPDRFSP